MKKMPPQKKREKEAKDTANINGSATNYNNNLGTQSNNNYQNGVNGTTINSETANNNAATALATATGSTEQIKLNGHQQEQELFLQAFEKPTQIYRFLRNRHGTSPIFLQRTLSYMKERMSRNHKKRNSFKINSMLDSLTQKSQTLTNNFLNIIYFGLFEKNASVEHSWQPGDVITVEATLYKITKSKRKDSTSDFQEVLTYTSTVVYNPHENMDQMTAISICGQSIQSLGDQHTIYKLLFRIKVTPPGNENVGDTNNETPTKRSKMATKLYGCEVIVYEKNIGCIPEGDYDAALQELNSTIIKSFSPKKRSWETLPDNYIPISMKFDVFSQYPTLKFRLTWSSAEIPKEFPSIDMEKYGCFAEIANGLENDVDSLTHEQLNNNNNSNHNNNNNIVKGSKTKGSSKGVSSKKPLAKTEKIQIVYNFLYSNNTRQQTEYTQEVICPWCGLDCMRLYSLLKHLKLCHARFNFTYQPAAGNGARIDVTINDSYDGSYAGSPYDLAGPSGCSFARTCGPVRRTSVTNFLVCRPRRQKTCLDEFLELDEDDLSNQRPYITGHNRLYHHTETCLPVHPKELDIDSEGESDPLWLRQKTIQMIDEFTDVNEGEKELMKLWNLHVMKHGFVGDCQLPIACEMFLDTNGYEIIRKNIYRNFILHMSSLYDYGLVSPETFYKIVQKLQGILSRYPEGQALMSRQREKQLKYWLEVGIHKQDEQKLKSPQKPIPPSVSRNSMAQNKTANETSSSNGSNKKSMQPPSKRSSTALKRTSIPPNNSVNGNGSPVDGDKAAANGKNVAKKTATQEDEVKEKLANGLRRLSNSGDKKSDAKMPVKENGDSKAQGIKRRLSMRDSQQQQQPASKRQRNDTNGSGPASNLANSTTSTNANSSSNRKQDTNAKRLTTRRQSLAGLPLESNSNSNKTQDKATAGGAVNGKNTSTSHTLRTRLSVPLTNKSDKR
ncbi:polycomb protein Su(z)12 [Haematobia irritans]|uniref:polycomb protein Su(z)12 n=1 Tax=Haematobia irritans TaxID=7368 RepID=UPI003F4F996A